MEKETKFIDVIVPLSVPNLYTYRVPFELNEFVKVGQRVVVQFGKKKLYTAIIRKIHHKAPKNYTAKYINGLLEDYPVVTVTQLKLWEWISEYYICHIGEVMLAALPSALKLSSETKVLKNELLEFHQLDFTDDEYMIMEALEVQNILSLQDISDITQKKEVYPIIKSLLNKKAILLEEELKTRFKPKVKSFVSLSEQFQDDTETAFELLKRAPKQQDILMVFLQLIGDDKMAEVERLVLQEHTQATSTQVKQLVEKGIVEIEEREVSRFAGKISEINQIFELSEDQEKAFQEIKSHWKTKPTVLLNGVTGSGKTEVYVKLIKEVVERKGKVLYLLPEIALTAQLVNRLKHFFGDKVGVYHSKFNANERVEIWENVLNNEQYDIVLGARSALFLPFKNLDLIVVDEEHETSFKQFDPAPRYNARDAALVLANFHKANVVLGSATPSIESYYNALEGKYGLVNLTKRFGDVKMPEIQCVDIERALKKKEMKSHFSSTLIQHIEQALENKEQIILFQNRRGYAPLWSCETCGWTPQCKQCDVSLTYHKYKHELSCHYCGSSHKPPTVCGACGSATLKMLGFGTEKIEEELEIYFPKAKIARMDYDTTRSKNAYNDIISSFENREVDILVGTQMVTKGLDFDNVALVSVLNADSMLSFPDFRSFERSFQLMAQVSGRAGRKKKRGKVLIQTYDPNHWVIQKVMYNDYEGLYNQEILERRNFKYPPFYRLINLTFKHRDKSVVDSAAYEFTKHLVQKLGKERVLGPEQPAISRIRNLYLKNTLLKFEREASIKGVKKILQDELNWLANQKQFKSVRVVVDVDPA